MEKNCIACFMQSISIRDSRVMAFQAPHSHIILEESITYWTNGFHHAQTH